MLRSAIDEALALFFLFDRQWTHLRAYASDKKVALLGDVPIYVLRDSADVWANPEGWCLDRDGRPTAVAGAPPDVFSADGQVWGMPLYDWHRMAKNDYRWWQDRLHRALALYDGIRLDHFRAFSAYWSVPHDAATARAGRWVTGPGLALFDALRRQLGPLPLCAEDLGSIDDNVRALMAALDIPGMKILHYAFGETADNPYLPHNIPERAVVYPGNHDNDTSVGWWNRLSPSTRTHAQHYLGRHGDDIAWDLVRVALSSSAQLAIIQMQDLLSLDSWARMNDPESYVRPPSQWRNWRWRLIPQQANADVAARFRFLGELYGRTE